MVSIRVTSTARSSRQPSADVKFCSERTLEINLRNGCMDPRQVLFLSLFSISSRMRNLRKLRCGRNDTNHCCREETQEEPELLGLVPDGNNEAQAPTQAAGGVEPREAPFGADTTRGESEVSGEGTGPPGNNLGKGGRESTAGQYYGAFSEARQDASATGYSQPRSSTLPSRNLPAIVTVVSTPPCT